MPFRDSRMGKELLIAWLLVLAMAFHIGVRAFEDHRPPINDVRYEPQNSPMAEGENLILRVYREKVRDDCPITSVRRATNASSGRTYPLAGRIWLGGEVGTEYTDLEIDTGFLSPGQYVGVIESRYDCPAETFIFAGQFLFTIEEAES